jgi:pantothenate kinase
MSALWQALRMSPTDADGPLIEAVLRSTFAPEGSARLLVPITASGLSETISVSLADLRGVYVPFLLWLRSRDAVCTRARCLIGIAGPAGSGKTTLAAVLEAMLAALSCSNFHFASPFPKAAKVEMDAYHLPNTELEELGLRKKKGAIETICGTALAGDLELLQGAPTVEATCVGPMRSWPHWSFVDDRGALLFPEYDRLGTHDPRLRSRAVSADVRLVLIEGLFVSRGDGDGWKLPLGPDPTAWARVRGMLEEVIHISAPLSLCRARCLSRRVRAVQLSAEEELGELVHDFLNTDAIPDCLRALIEPKLDAVVDHYARADAPSWYDIAADAVRATVRIKLALAPSLANAESEAGGDPLRVPWRRALEALRAIPSGAFADYAVD